MGIYQPRLASVLCVALLSGCTAGYYVDESFNALPRAVETTIVQLDSNGNAVAHFNYDPGPAGSPYVSFDPFVATSPNADGNGHANVSSYLPPGDYYVTQLVFSGFGTTLYVSSPVFRHDYYTTCTDYFTKSANETCAPYYFQIFGSCTSWQCVNQNGNGSPPARVQDGWRVVPMIRVAVASPFADPRAPGRIDW